MTPPGTALGRMGDSEYSAIVMGASAGGLDAMSAVLSCLPADHRLPVLAVQHLHPSDQGGVAVQLNRRTALEVCEPCDKEEIQPGHVYFAPANYHMLVERNGTIALSVDNQVNWSRPSIDVLFESAALVWEARLIGVILSGTNNDGTAGMRMIGEHGGLLIAQDPTTAERPEMPRTAIEEAEIELILPPDEIGGLLLELGGPQGGSGSGGEEHLR